jgi:hypothetical protein
LAFRFIKLTYEQVSNVQKLYQNLRYTRHTKVSKNIDWINPLTNWINVESKITFFQNWIKNNKFNQPDFYTGRYMKVSNLKLLRFKILAFFSTILEKLSKLSIWLIFMMFRASWKANKKYNDDDKKFHHKLYGIQFDFVFRSYFDYLNSQKDGLKFLFF